MYRIFVIAVSYVWTAVFSAKAQDADAYLQHIKPVFKERCYACHGALKQKAGLRLDTADLIKQGSEDGSILKLEDPENSPLLLRLIAPKASDRMPPEGKPVDPETVAAIRSWLSAKAPSPPGELPEQDPLDHWAFLPPLRPKAIPLASHPVDALLAEAQDGLGLKPQAPAESRLLMRRLFLDLVGLPPRPEDIQAYLKNPTQHEYEKVVDQLLASPQYGERWGRHWMDVWRYSDWFGLGDQLRYSQKHIWHWRDWILESLNADKGYDQMIREMLAADEMYPLDHDRLRATGFLARNYFLFNRTTWLDKTIEHTGKAFLGLTLQCGKCHDHKYDPISQNDYYRFRAILEPHQIRTDALPGTTNLDLDGLPRAFDMHPDAPTYVHLRGNEKNPDTSEPMQAAPPAFLNHLPFEPVAITLPGEAHRPELQEHFLQTLLKEAERDITSLKRSLEQAGGASADGTSRALELEYRAASLRPAYIRSSLEATRLKVLDPESSQLESLLSQAGEAALAYDLARLDWEEQQAEQALADASEEKRKGLQTKRDAVRSKRKKREQQYQDNPQGFKPFRASIKALESPAETEEERQRPYPQTSTGRRTALARWITHPDHPLTARVAVNHIWMRHFGVPLVEPVTNFGRQTSAPKLQKVLDYLAVTLQENQWRMKPMHRLIVTSEAYQRSSSIRHADPHTLAADPDNQYLWRQHPTRMESQVIRDSLLQLSGQLTHGLGGPSIPVSSSDDAPRRSLYFAHSRDDQHPFLNTFDDASIIDCYRRKESIIPQQALAMANSLLSMDAAEKIATHLQRSAADSGEPDAEFVRRAFEYVLGWTPDEEETLASVDMLQAWKLDTSPEQPTPRASLVHVLLNHNDFITIR